jgi:catechol 2,3-dioxygenase-like lactoylglutathione lyase family enzyme
VRVDSIDVDFIDVGLVDQVKGIANMELHFDCVFYYVRSLEEAVHFYSDVLGLRLESRDAVARFRIDGVLFELVPTPDEHKLSGHGNARLTLEVGDIGRAVRDLHTRGVTVGDVVAVSNGWLAPFYDPDGNDLLLWQYARPAE